MNDSRPLRVGLIGLGAVGAVHLQAYRQANGIEVVAAAELDSRRLIDLAQQFGFTAYRDCCDMIAQESLDIACVLTPAAQHRSVAELCAQSGIATLSEKPLAHNAVEARGMIETFERLGVPLFYGSSYRYLPAVVRARELILSGAIGKVVLLRESHVGGAGPEAQISYSSVHYPSGSPGGTGMGLVDHGIHLLDIFPWLIDSEITSAWGRGNRTDHPLASEYAVLHFANGATGMLLYEDGSWSTALPGEGMFSLGAGWDHRGYIPPGQWENEPGTIHVHGTAGALRIHHYAHSLFLVDREGVKQVPLSGAPAPGHFARQIEAFADDIRCGRSPSTHARDGLRALDILETIYHSS